MNPFEQAAKLIASADGILITAGAGMGVDSGLPDFRGSEGFWEAYPALANSGIDFTSIANHYAFKKDPQRAWGFYGHRLALYRKTEPHEGFRLLKNIADRMAAGAFIITSNVDGQFQKAGFSETRILEIHGSIHRLQCCTPCRDTVWSADAIEPTIDDDRCRWVGNKLPTCNRCRKLARPNILMFDDWVWIGVRAEIQRATWQVWANQVGAKVVIELGAGVDIPSIRHISQNQGCPLIRINPRNSNIPEGSGVSLSMGAKDALNGIAIELGKMGFFDRLGDEGAQDVTSVSTK
jgi:NAD-dependent SIR2 family protein deacetylase